ncbi:amino acid ABC transporter permease [Sporosarcina limicola]|uniref:Polar amino acid transport system permease protein n=1 Tax=Sporosarcina limicola TaxID=34101 RepID=A0A927ME01_9BACL|nr:amino acid ABC transporter permease [Sporosarcina limicola]MBE1553009.1 polar amino acid transport system permease protein [Sporosarcina limicola]
MDFRFDIIIEYAPFLLKGLLYTIGLSVGGIVLGTVLGFFIALGKMSKFKLVRIPFIWYINFFRGTPLLVQLFLVHFGLMPLLMSPTNTVISALVALSLNSAAYVAEIFRAGIQSIDKGQDEAARSLGMGSRLTMGHIIFPQAFRRMIPPLGNEFITLLKDSSLAAIIATPELMYWGRAASGQYFRVWEPYLAVAFTYLLLTLSLTYLLNYVEKRLSNK